MSLPSYYGAGPCQSCNYAQHCAGNRDEVTGVSGYPDSCRDYDSYEITPAGKGWKRYEKIPYRVAGAAMLRVE